MNVQTRILWHERLIAVDIELRVAATAARCLSSELQANPSFGIDDEWSSSDARRWMDHLESTYMIRLFAAFEQALRDYWGQGLGRASHPKTEDLIESIATRRGVPEAIRVETHDARRYRNCLVHEEASPAAPLTMKQVQRVLSSYLSRLPLSW